MRLSHVTRNKIFDGGKLQWRLMRAAPDEEVATKGAWVSFRWRDDEAIFEEVKALLEGLGLLYDETQPLGEAGTLAYHPRSRTITYVLPPMVNAKSLIALAEHALVSFIDVGEGWYQGHAL